MSDQNIAPAIHERKGHTPGPWIYRANEYDDWGMVRAAPDAKGRMFVICQARNPSVRYDDLDKYRVSRTDPYEANARLIAAAPELLEALKPFAAMAAAYDPEADGDDDQDAWFYGARPTIGQLRRARAAITKAEG